MSFKTSPVIQCDGRRARSYDRRRGPITNHASGRLEIDECHRSVCRAYGDRSARPNAALHRFWHEPFPPRDRSAPQLSGNERLVGASRAWLTWLLALTSKGPLAIRADRRYRAQPRGFAKSAFPGRLPSSPPSQIAQKRLEFKAIARHLDWFRQIGARRAGAAQNFGPFCLRRSGRGRILRFANGPPGRSSHNDA